jgi:hypothetical protein
MRYLSIIFLVCLAAYACKKRPTKNPTPALEFKNFEAFQNIRGRDTAVLTIGYEDGDGDIFVDEGATGSNLFITPYSYNEPTNSFKGIIDPITNDTLMFSYVVHQPDNGYYKNKSIKGDIIVPLGEFRENKQQKILKYTVYMVDMAGRKSNIVTSKTYTITF